MKMSFAGHRIFFYSKLSLQKAKKSFQEFGVPPIPLTEEEILSKFSTCTFDNTGKGKNFYGDDIEYRRKKKVNIF